MGFFSDLKDDLSQAVNELMPEEGAEEAEAKKNAEAEEAADDGSCEVFCIFSTPSITIAFLDIFNAATAKLPLPAN